MAYSQSIPTLYPVAIDGLRLRLREVDESDFEAAWAWASRPEFFRFLPIDQPSREDEHVWLESVIKEAQAAPRRQYQLGIDASDAGGLVGMVRIGIDSERHRSASIGYGINPDFWGRGYATEAARLIVRFGFETLGLHRIWATHHPENGASRRVLDKIGFREEGRRRDDRFVDGAWYDSVVCSILESDSLR
jgi:RimJ/RimL family protein N-acetyltransferase